MISNLDYTTLQQVWWILCSVVGSLFLFLTFVQGGNTLLWQVAKNDVENALVVNSLGHGVDVYDSSFGARSLLLSEVLCHQFRRAYWV